MMAPFSVNYATGQSKLKGRVNNESNKIQN
jgi:hypothetical protein